MMKYIAILFLIFILVIIILADQGSIPDFIKVLYDFPNGDKLGHFILFGLLNFFITLTCLRALPLQRPKLVALSIGLILALLVGAEEYSQKFFEKRTFDLIDLTASYVGLIVGGWVALKLKK
jgi:polysaccharide biosynthesis protein VpsQ